MHSRFVTGRFAIVIAAPVIVLALSACTLAGEPVPAGPIESGPLPGQASRLIPAAKPDSWSGARLFAQHCVKCHGAQGKGDGESAAALASQGATLPDFTNPAFGRSHSLQSLFRMITEGNIQKFMPPWDNTLSDTDRWDVAAYVSSLSVSASAPDKGQPVYAAKCASCHAADGSKNKLDDPGVMAVLSPQDIFDRYIGAGSDGIHTFRGQLDEDARWAVTDYIRTFSTNPPQAAAAPSPTPGASPESSVTPEGTPIAPAASVTGEIRGRVTNGTPGGASPAGMEVQLKGGSLDANGQIVEFLSQQTTVAPDGSYSFSGLPFDKQQAAYGVTIVYNGVEFSNGELIDPAKPSMDLPVTIYESTTDPSVLSVAAHHVVLRQRPGALLVNEVLILSNSSDKVYVSAEPVAGGRKGSVAITLPPDAFSLSFDQGSLGGRFVQAGATIYDTEQVLPGNKSDTVSFSYVVPFSGSRDVSLDVAYPTDQVNVLAQPDLDVSSAVLKNLGQAAIPGENYIRYSADHLTAGQALAFRVSTPVQLIDVLRTALSVLLAALVVVSGALWFLGRRNASLPAGAETGDTVDQGLVEQIAALDDDFEAGKINRYEYEQRRAELKAELAEKLEEGNSPHRKRRTHRS